ncbi:hypothetical protein [Actinokineospora pegani]|uniref:hypothetical protein n=1 Tax=Actinokineospora pegani TaxID=2654637 RepID=UPI001F456F5E|nr:hypothetical protein [Actinokineospora pegani]
MTLNAALADKGAYAGTLTIGGLVRGGDIHAMVTADPGRYGEVGTLDPEEIAATAWAMATTRDRAESVFTPTCGTPALSWRYPRSQGFLIPGAREWARWRAGTGGSAMCESAVPDPSGPTQVGAREGHRNGRGRERTAPPGPPWGRPRRRARPAARAGTHRTGHRRGSL